MKKRSFAGSHPEEHYVPATRKLMYLDRPTSHGGWPEGEYNPPVADRLYGWYKKMKMMPEDDQADDDSEYIKAEGSSMRKGLSMMGMSGELKRDTMKQHAGEKIGFSHGKWADELTDELAAKLIGGEMEVRELLQHRNLIRNVLSIVRSEGEYDLAREIEGLLRTDEGYRAGRYVAQRGNQMRITESMLRRIIREEYSQMKEADDTKGADLCKKYILKEKPTQSDKEKLASDLKEKGVTGEDAVNAAFEAGLALVMKDPAKSSEYFNMDYTLTANEIAGLQKKMNEGQRGNDENGQNDNDTDPSDPRAKNLRESRRLALRREVLAEMRRRGII